MRTSFFGDIEFYKNFNHFESFKNFSQEDIIEIYEKIYSAELKNNNVSMMQAETSKYMEKVLLNSIFKDEAKELSKKIVKEHDRLTTIDRTFLLTIMQKDYFFDKNFKIKNLNVLLDAYDNFGGCVLSLGHAGPHIILILILAQLNKNLRITAAGYMPDVLVDNAFKYIDHLEFNSLELLPFSKSFFDDCFKVLNEGILIAYPEYSRSKKRFGKTTEFLGQEVNMPLGASRLSHKAKKPIVCAYIHKHDNYHYELEFSELIKPSEDDDFELHAQNTRKIFSFLESRIISNPSNWEGWQYFEFMGKHVGENKGE